MVVEDEQDLLESLVEGLRLNSYAVDGCDAVSYTHLPAVCNGDRHGVAVVLQRIAGGGVGLVHDEVLAAVGHVAQLIGVCGAAAGDGAVLACRRVELFLRDGCLLYTSEVGPLFRHRLHEGGVVLTLSLIHI